jgi:hypothetical protein
VTTAGVSFSNVASHGKLLVSCDTVNHQILPTKFETRPQSQDSEGARRNDTA